jgi:hypothetical protein
VRRASGRDPDEERGGARRAAARAVCAAAIAGAGFALGGCGGGSPLLHPARTLPTGDFRLATGVSANVATGPLAGDLRRAREIAERDPTAPGAPGSSPDYSKGALVAAAVAPGLAPFVGARVGIGDRFEGGLAYTGRAVRGDVRRSFDAGRWSLSLGGALSAALYGRQQGSDLPNVDLGALHGYGADVPVIAGWESDGGLYMAWFGARGGFEHDVVETLTSEPKSVTIGGSPIHLDATRFWGGGLVGVATGFNHVHVALEMDVAWQTVSGSYNASHVNVRGLSLAPATALWWTF